jgi:hypothetical protein
MSMIVESCWALRSAALRADLHPITRKPRVLGTPGLRRKEEFPSALLRHG